MPPHWDEPCSPLVAQLNGLDEFVGGGTKFGHARAPLSVAPHSGVPPPLIVVCPLPSGSAK